ncbi:uncharacterized protein [Eucyclogobius newberryi]|uniref:uncharacterized protein n=1 Tax=Eucyclogobius newberryi TaxID=166745 RepID=UPI003B5C9CB0
MGAIRTAISLFILQKQVELIMCSKITFVGAREGDSVTFTCKYPPATQNNPRFFCQARPVCKSHLIGTFPPQHWETNGRFALHDNITAGQFVVQMDRLDPEDSGTYWCGVKNTDNPDYITVFQLNVTQTTTTRAAEPRRPHVRNQPMFVAVVSCLSALVVVFLFTLCLFFTVRNRRHPRQRARAQETSEDYVVMKSAVRPEPRSPDTEIFPTMPQNPPPGVCFTDQRRPKHTESFALQEAHTEDQGPNLFSHYQGLDLSSVEEHIYHGISNKPVKD